MKTKSLRALLPLMAILFAVGFAFTTEQKSLEEGVLVTGYIFQNGQCISASKDCNNLGSTPCTYNGNQVFRNRASSTSCSAPMTHRP